MYDEPATRGVSRLAAGVAAVSRLALIAAGPLHHLGLASRGRSAC